MHYSPQDLMLGADAQASINIDAAGNKFSLDIGQPEARQEEEQISASSILFGVLVFGAIYWITTSGSR